MEGINEKEGSLQGGRFNVANIVDIIGGVWLVGVLILIFRDVRHYYKLKKRLKGSPCIEGNLYRYNGTVPFVFGIIRPKIFLPWDLELDEATYIIQHEQVHIKRKDYLIKIIAAGIVNMHWFNPLVWLAFSKMSQDMELSCDEQVMKTGEKGCKKVYAQLLLKHATQMEFKPILMFGKHPIEKRVAHVLSYENSKRWKCLIAGILVVLVGLGVMVQSISTRATSAQEQTGTHTEPDIEKAVAAGEQSGARSVQGEDVFLVEERESREVIARILKVDLENRSLVVEGLSKNSPLGESCIVSCESSLVYKQRSDLSQERYAFESLEAGDIVSLLIDDVKETYPAQTYAGEIVWLGSRKDAELESINYSVMYITKEGNSISLENIRDAQKRHIERLITQYSSTSFALPGRNIEEIGDFYRILCISKEGNQAYLVYQIGGEAYIQQSTYGDLNQVGQCQKIDWADYQEITLWYQ